MAVHTGCVNVHIKAFYNVHKTISPMYSSIYQVRPSVYYELGNNSKAFHLK